MLKINKKNIITTIALASLSTNSVALINSEQGNPENNMIPLYFSSEKIYNPTINIQNSNDNNETVFEAEIELPLVSEDKIDWDWGFGNPNTGESLAIYTDIYAPTIDFPNGYYNYTYRVSSATDSETFYTSQDYEIGIADRIRYAITINEQTGQYTLRSDHEINPSRDTDNTIGTISQNAELFSYMETRINSASISGESLVGQIFYDDSDFVFDWGTTETLYYTTCGDDVVANNESNICNIDMSADYSSFAPTYEHYPVSDYSTSTFEFSLNGTTTSYLEIDKNIELLNNPSATVELSCNATLITNTFAITAANCLDNANNMSDYTVFVGDNKYSDNLITTTTINNFIIEPLYNNSTYENDVAIIELADPINSYTPIDIVSDIENNEVNNNLGTNTLSIFSWGDIDLNENKANDLQTISLGNEDTNNCSSYLTIYGSQYCLKDFSLNNQNVCTNDEGAPSLTNNNLLHSIYSYSSDPCGSNGAIFTNIYNEINFFETNINDFYNLSFSPTYTYDGTNINVLTNIENKSQINSANNIGLRVSSSEDISVIDTSGQLSCSAISTAEFDCTSAISLPPSGTINSIELQITNTNNQSNAFYTIELYADGEDYYEIDNTDLISHQELTNALLNLTKNSTTSYINSSTGWQNVELNFNLENISILTSINTKLNIVLPTGMFIERSSIPCNTEEFPVVCNVGDLLDGDIENITILLKSKDPIGRIFINTYSDNDIEILNRNTRSINYKSSDIFTANTGLNNNKTGVDSKSGGSLGILLLSMLILLNLRKPRKPL